ncbi:MAG TPA: hypothetical protein VF157_13750, partial [Chloroflexota bacterium]
MAWALTPLISVMESVGRYEQERQLAERGLELSAHLPDYFRAIFSAQLGVAKLRLGLRPAAAIDLERASQLAAVSPYWGGVALSYLGIIA